MILADKIMNLRKKQGWSQEELAEKLDVSRQSVSKWEGGLSIPDLNKIIAMSSLFGVSTDYLLKDELEQVTPSETQDSDDALPARKIDAEDANRYLDRVGRISWRIAVGVMLCVLSPVALILLMGVSEAGRIEEGFAAAVGLLALFAFIAAAVAIFVPNGISLSEYGFLEKEPICLEYGVRGIVEKKRDAYAQRYTLLLTFGILLCVVSVIPLIVLGAMGAGETVLIACMALIFVACSVGVLLIVRACYIQGSFQKLLQTGDYTETNKKREKENAVLDTVYWGVATAVYLGVSFLTHAWHVTWILWPIAGCLYPVAEMICRNAKKN